MNILFTVISYVKRNGQFSIYPVGYALQDGSWLKIVDSQGRTYGRFSCFEELKEFFIC